MSVERSIALRGPAPALQPVRSEFSECPAATPAVVARLDHDLRNSLNLLLGALDLLAATTLTPEQQKLVDLGKRSASSLREVIAAHSADSQGWARASDAALIRYLAKPVTGAELCALVGETSVRSDGPSRILLADDSEEMRWLLESALAGSHRIDCAEDGRVAFDRFKAGRYDLVIADLEMPLMNGRELVSAMRQWERESKRAPTPIVMLTGHSLETPILIRPDEDLRHLIPAFLEVRHRDVDTLSRALAGGDYATIQKLGHRLKGTGASYGFDGITEIGCALEEAAIAHRPADVEHQIDVLRDYLRRVRVI